MRYAMRRQKEGRNVRVRYGKVNILTNLLYKNMMPRSPVSLESKCIATQTI